MIASKEIHCFWEVYLGGEQGGRVACKVRGKECVRACTYLNRVEKDEDLNGEAASVHEVAEEEVLGILRRASDFEDLQ